MTDTTPLHTRAPATPIRPDIQRASGQAPVNLAFDESVIPQHSVHTLVFRSMRRTHELFQSDEGNFTFLYPEEEISCSKIAPEKVIESIKAKDQYGPIMHLVQENEDNERKRPGQVTKIKPSAVQGSRQGGDNSMAVVAVKETEYEKIPKHASFGHHHNPSSAIALASSGPSAIVPRKPIAIPKPEWHAPWKLYRVISGHTGWVRCLAVEPGNEWFASGSNDRIIKIWDLATGRLKLSLTGHVSGVRGLAVSHRHPYLFSAGEDKTVKCWDLEYNKVIRHYHGHLSAVYSIAVHPTIDLLITGGRDSVARVWDMRTKAQIHSLGGHSNTVASVQCQAVDPQVITGSHDTTIRTWDIIAGKTRSTLTHHKKSVRSVVIHPKLNMFASGAADNIKEWLLPDGKFIQNLEGHESIINTLGANADGVLVSGSDNGQLYFWDWRTGYNFQRFQSPAQPGSLDAEAGIFQMTFDQSGCRLITAEADKTIKVFKEDETATPESHPINWKPDLFKVRKY